MLILLALPAALAGQLDVAVGTDFPVSIGPSVSWQHESRLLLQGQVGILPRPYVGVINGAMTAFGVYGDTTADLIDTILQNSMVLHGQVGYQILQDRPLTVSLGYQFVGLAGDTTNISMYSEAGIPGALFGQALQANDELDVALISSMITAEVGTHWLVKERLVLRASAGFGFTVNANATVTSSSASSGLLGVADAELINDAVEVYLEDIFERYVHVPTLGFSVGYRLR